MILRYTYIGQVVWKMDRLMIQAPSSGKMLNSFITTLTVHYGYTLAIECTLVVSLLLWCIMVE